MAAGVQSPEKELRFTRSGQAVGILAAAAVMGAVALTLVATSIYREENPAVPHALWALLPLAAAVLLVALAVHLTRHAYLILTPLGIEVFPFFRPASEMRLVAWQEVALAEVDESLRLLTLHHDVDRKSGVRLSLRPVRADRRELLVRAVMGRVTKAS